MSECEQVGIRRRRRLSRILVVAGALAGMSAVWNLAQESSADAAGVAEVTGAPDMSDVAESVPSPGAAEVVSGAEIVRSDPPDTVDGLLRDELIGPVQPEPQVQPEPRVQPKPQVLPEPRGSDEPALSPVSEMLPETGSAVIDADQLVLSTVRTHDLALRTVFPLRHGEHPQWTLGEPGQRDVPAFSGDFPMEFLDGPPRTLSPSRAEYAPRDTHPGSPVTPRSDRLAAQRQAASGSVPSDFATPAHVPSSCAGVDSGFAVAAGFDSCRSDHPGSTGNGLAAAHGTATYPLVSMSRPQPGITPD